MKTQNPEIDKAFGKKLTREYGSTMDTAGFISVYDSHVEAEAAVKEMEKSGFDMKKLSIIGKNYQTEENVVGFYNMGQRTKYWGKLGAFWGGIWGLIFGSAFFVIPGVGPVVIAGTFISTLVGALEGAVVVGGLSALGAALYSIGIPKNSIVHYETALKAGKYLMIAHGTTADLKKAKDIVNNSGAKNITDFDSKDVPTSESSATH